MSFRRHRHFLPADDSLRCCTACKLTDGSPGLASFFPKGGQYGRVRSSPWASLQVVTPAFVALRFFSLLLTHRVLGRHRLKGDDQGDPLRGQAGLYGKSWTEHDDLLEPPDT